MKALYYFLKNILTETAVNSIIMKKCKRLHFERKEEEMKSWQCM